MRKANNRRSTLECYLDVLSALSRNGSMPKLRLLYAANLSGSLFKKILTNLISRNMIREQSVSTDRRRVDIILLPLGAETYKGINKYLSLLGITSDLNKEAIKE